MATVSSEPEFDLPADIPDEFAKRIGQIAADWGALEFQINEAIWLLAAVFPLLGACITAQIYSLDGRLLALLALLKARGASSKLIGDVNALREESRGATERRNRNIHDARTVVRPGNETHRLEVTARATLTFDLVKVPIDDLIRDQTRVRACVDKFGTLRARILSELPTLPGIPIGQLERIKPAPLRPIQTPSSDGK